jgi:hypothetical protein
MEDGHRYSKASLLFSEIAHNCRAQATRYKALSKLFAVANQPLPEPPKAPLVGSCICDTWERKPSAPLTDETESYAQFNARANVFARKLLARDGHVFTGPDSEDFAGHENPRAAKAYQDAVELLSTDETPLNGPPASGKRPVDAPWIPDEPSTWCPRNPACTLGPSHGHPCNAPNPDLDELPQPEAVELPPIRFCDKWCTMAENHEGICVPVFQMNDGTTLPGATAVESVEEPDGKMTAREWRNSKHFLMFMKQKCFANWNAEQQGEAGDLFVKHAELTWPNLKMNRWGDRFKAFSGLKEKK